MEGIKVGAPFNAQIEQTVETPKVSFGHPHKDKFSTDPFLREAGLPNLQKGCKGPVARCCRAGFEVRGPYETFYAGRPGHQFCKAGAQQALWTQ